jgi:hypothetical protein
MSDHVLPDQPAYRPAPFQYAMPIVAGINSPEIAEYPPLAQLAKMTQQLNKPDIREQLKELIVSFFQMLRRFVDRDCERKDLSYSKLVFTIPYQWDDYKAVQDCYESIIQQVWPEKHDKIEFIFEVEGLAHALLSEEKRLFQLYSHIAFADLGGHTGVRY